MSGYESHSEEAGTKTNCQIRAIRTLKIVLQVGIKVLYVLAAEK